MRTLLASLLCITLTGCAGLTAYVQQHAIGIALIGTVAGTTGAVEGVVINTKELLNGRATEKK